MKQIKTLALALVLFLGTQATQAQVKIAHINTTDLMLAMPAVKDAQAQLKKLQEQYEGESKIMIDEFQAKQKKYEAEAATVGDAVNETRMKELQDTGGRIQQFRETASKNIQDKEIELMRPLMEKARAAIQKVATGKGYQYVLDASQGSGLLVTDGPDMMADVRKELGIPDAPVAAPKK